MAKILLLDIETTPNIVTTWGLKVPGEYIDHGNLRQERYTLSAAWKWLGESKVHSMAADVGKKNPQKRLIKKLHKVFLEADAIVAHNGKRYDVPWVRGMFMKEGLGPTPIVEVIDTCLIARSAFFLNSNKLDYLGKFLGIGQKIKTDFDLWLHCMAGDKKAMAQMLKYNCEDVRLLEKVYLKLRPFVPARFNAGLDDAGSGGCPTCGGARLHKRGFGQTRVTKFQRYQCNSCGAWSQRPLRSKTIR